MSNNYIDILFINNNDIRYIKPNIKWRKQTSTLYKKKGNSIKNLIDDKITDQLNDEFKDQIKYFGYKSNSNNTIFIFKLNDKIISNNVKFPNIINKAHNLSKKKTGTYICFSMNNQTYYFDNIKITSKVLNNSVYLSDENIMNVPNNELNHEKIKTASNNELNDKNSYIKEKLTNDLNHKSSNNNFKDSIKDNLYVNSDGDSNDEYDEEVDIDDDMGDGIDDDDNDKDDDNDDDDDDDVDDDNDDDDEEDEDIDVDIDNISTNDISDYDSETTDFSDINSDKNFVVKLDYKKKSKSKKEKEIRKKKPINSSSNNSGNGNISITLKTHGNLNIINDILDEETTIVTDVSKLHSNRIKNISIFNKLDITKKNIQIIEQSIYNYTINKCINRLIIPTWDNDMFNTIYFNKSISIFTNLFKKSYVKNYNLIDKVKKNQLDLKNIAFLEPFELFPEKYQDIIEEKIKREQIIKNAIKQSATNQFKCPRCKQCQATYVQVQTRSADEPMTTFITCQVCGKQWKQY